MHKLLNPADGLAKSRIGRPTLKNAASTSPGDLYNRSTHQETEWIMQVAHIRIHMQRYLRFHILILEV